MAIYNNFPQLRRERGYSVTTEGHRKRAELHKDIATITAGKPKICAICGNKENLRLHHIVPVDHGGTNDPINLIFLCETCHVALHERIYKTWGKRGQSKKLVSSKAVKENIPPSEIKRKRMPAPKPPQPKKAPRQPEKTTITYNKRTRKTKVFTLHPQVIKSLLLDEAYTVKKRAGRKRGFIFECDGNPIKREGRKEEYFREAMKTMFNKDID